MRKRVTQLLLFFITFNAAVPCCFLIDEDRQAVSQAFSAQTMMYSILCLPIHPMKTINELYLKKNNQPASENQKSKRNSTKQSSREFVFYTESIKDLRLENSLSKGFNSSANLSMSYVVVAVQSFLNISTLGFMSILFVMILFVMRPRSSIDGDVAIITKLIINIDPGLNNKLGFLFYAPLEVKS